MTITFFCVNSLNFFFLIRGADISILSSVFYLPVKRYQQQLKKYNIIEICNLTVKTVYSLVQLNTHERNLPISLSLSDR